MNQQSALMQQFQTVLNQLPNHEHGTLIQRSLETLLAMTQQELDRLDWKILSASLLDMQAGFKVFHPHRHTRKIAIFGSSRLPEDSSAYQMARDFAQSVVKRGYLVMTGAGGGIMAAGNLGATAEQSFGLNIDLPFEQSSNPHIANDPKLIDFKYFFTRKLFFLRETDAIAVFPGGFGTQDEVFECLTLSQTGKSSPIPVVLIAPPDSTYWHDWDDYIRKQLTQQNLISPEDHRLYQLTSSIDDACAYISHFYQVYHSCRYVDDRLVIRLKCEPSDAVLERLNESFQDILLSGKIEKSASLPEEINPKEPQPKQDDNQVESLPRLVFHFNQRDHGRLYQLIDQLNSIDNADKLNCHPEAK